MAGGGPPAAADIRDNRGRIGLSPLPPEKCASAVVSETTASFPFPGANLRIDSARPLPSGLNPPLTPDFSRFRKLRRFAPFIVPFRDGPIDDARDESANLTHANPFQMPQVRGGGGTHTHIRTASPHCVCAALQLLQDRRLCAAWRKLAGSRLVWRDGRRRKGRVKSLRALREEHLNPSLMRVPPPLPCP